MRIQKAEREYAPRRLRELVLKPFSSLSQEVVNLDKSVAVILQSCNTAPVEGQAFAEGAVAPFDEIMQLWRRVGCNLAI